MQRVDRISRAALLVALSSWRRVQPPRGSCWLAQARPHGDAVWARSGAARAVATATAADSRAVEMAAAVDSRAVEMATAADSRAVEMAAAADSRAVETAVAVPTALTFPGQGSQTVGMALDLCEHFAAAREVMEEVDDALQTFLSRLMFEGDTDELTLTRNAQPAILAHSLCAVRVLQAEGLWPASIDASLGHSVGHFAALVAAGSLPLADAARLLRKRGEAMQRAAPRSFAMVACMPTSQDAMLELLRERHAGLAGSDGTAGAGDGAFDDAAGRGQAAAAWQHGGVVELANANTPKQVVLSGDAEAVAEVAEVAKRRRIARRVAPLQVSAPFHCSLMQPAADELRAALAQTPPLTQPCVPVVSNVTALPLRAGPAEGGHSATGEVHEWDAGEWSAALKRDIVEQVTAPVRWSDSLEYVVSARQSLRSDSGVAGNSGGEGGVAGDGDGASAAPLGAFLELGPGKVLTGLARQTVGPHHELVNVATVEDVRALRTMPPAWLVS